MRPKNLFLVRLLALWGLCALLVACGRRETAVDEARRTQTLLYAIAGEPNDLDPHTINSPSDYMIVPAFFESLVTNDPSTLEARPGVAERWEISPDGRVYTFYLRSDAKWSNGDAVTAADFLYSFQRALSPAIGSQYTFLFDAVVGAAAYAKGDVRDFSQVGFAASDVRTVQITLRQPTAYFLSIVANNPVWYPVHRATIERHGRMDQRGTAWTRPENFVGNGPFVPREWRPGQVIVAERASTYWNADSVRLRAIKFFAMDSVEAQERAFRAGQLHVASLVPPTRVPVYRREAPHLLRERLILSSFFLNLNTARPPLDNVKVRRALSLALRRGPMIERALFGGGEAAGTIVPPGLMGYPSPTPVAEQAEAARAALAEAGYPGGVGFPKLEIMSSVAADPALTQAIQEVWRTVLGIDVAIVQMETRVLWSNLQAKNYTIARGGWNGDFADASTFLELWRSGNGWNFTHWSDARYDELLSAAASELDPSARQAQLAAAEARLLEELPVIPLYFSRRPELIDPSVRDWPDNVQARHPFQGVWLQAREN